ncbi:MAG: dienelactone hydrolase family protein [Actinobacteria bacterium]|nr:dienelactone hydrolase family protein [Actinomycetota bacterium]
MVDPASRRALAVPTTLALAALVALSVLVLPSAAAGAAEGCSEESWIGGIVELCDGALVYRDYVFDDYGANEPLTVPPARNTGSLSGTAGDQRYPGVLGATADLVDLTLRIVGDELEAVFELNALYEPGQTVAAIAIDTDADPTTGGGAWIDGDLDLGISSDGWEVLETFRTGDPVPNLITGRLPLPAGERWRVQAVTAQADGTVMNVAFRGTDEETRVGNWFEDRQAAALEDGDISAFAAEVVVADLTSGATRPAAEPSGYHSRVYVSEHTIGTGEGMSYDPVWGRDGNSGEICEQAFHYFGRYQPYGIYIPEGDGPTGLQLALHGCNANHASLVDQPGMQSQLGEALDRIIVVPLGRGPVGYYSDISERDVLDVLDDVTTTYDVDPDRVFSGGYSMGGYGAYRFAMLYPHRFAGMINWVGFTGDGNNNPTGTALNEYDSGAVGNVIDFVRNLRHVPSALLYAGADELVQSHTHTAMAQRFAAEGGAYEYFLHPYADHFTFALADDWEKEAAWTSELTRVTDVATVVYRTAAFLGNEEFGIRHDEAYWLSAIRGREDAYIDLEATTSACGGERPLFEDGNDAGVGPAAFAWVSQNRHIVGGEPTTEEDRLEATFSNVASVTVDVEEACLGGKDITYAITTDGPTVVRFSDGRSLALDEGEHHGVLAAGASAGPGASAGAPGAGGPGPLPATGGGAPLAGVVAAAAGLVLARRRRA